MKKISEYIFLGLLGVMILWIFVIIAPVFSSGLKGPDALKSLTDALSHPLRIRFVKETWRAVGISVIVYSLFLLIYYSSRKNYRRGIEYGSAKWGDAGKITRKMRSKKNDDNIILSQNMRLGMADNDVKRHKRNLNVIVNGGSGSGKTLFYVTPNVLQANSSFIILDPKMESLYRLGNYLSKEKGYKVRVLNLLDMECSFGYNPFVYIRKDHVDEDIQVLVTNIFLASNPKGKGNQDPFWDQTASMMLKAIMLYIYYTCDKDEQNFRTVNLMLRYARISEKGTKEKSAVDVLFEDLRSRDPLHTAVAYYDLYSDAADNTLKSIKITLVSKLEKFLVPALERISINDEMDIGSIGREKTAIFAVIPDNDTSYNFLVSILYNQMFQQLYKIADEEYHGRLPVQVHFIMDEFANVALPNNFQQILSTMRSRGINVSIIIQNIAQLKTLFEKEWESIIGNCDTFIYLGGNEQGTHEYVSRLLGKETIDMEDHSRSKGRSGSFSTSDKALGRELMTPSEVRLMDNRDCLVFIRGEEPVKDKKYDIFKDSRTSFTAPEGFEPYIKKKRFLVSSDIWDNKQEDREYKKDELKKKLKSNDASKVHPLFK